MVSSKDKARQQFAAWLGDALDRAGVVKARGRPQAVAKRYKVSVPAARKWLIGTSVPDSARMLTIVQDLEGVTGESNYTAAGLLPRIGHHVREGTAVVAAGEILPGYVRLPLLAMEAGMGFGTEIEGPPEVVQFLDVAQWWADLNLPRPISRIKIITGRGDSNAPLINNGDIVFVDTVDTRFEGEGLYVLNWQGRALIKRLVANLRTGTLQIVSANPAYPMETVEPGEIDQLHIAGRVAAWYTLKRF